MNNEQNTTVIMLLFLINNLCTGNIYSKILKIEQGRTTSKIKASFSFVKIVFFCFVSS